MQINGVFATSEEKTYYTPALSYQEVFKDEEDAMRSQ